MNKTDEIKTELLTRGVVGLGRLLTGLSDTAMLRLMRAARRLIGDPAMRAGFEEIVEAFAKGPPNTTLIRRMIEESQYDELRDMMFGTFVFKEMDIEDL